MIGPTMMQTPEQIAEGLSPAQRRWMSENTEWRKPRPWAEDRWMTFPPSNVHRVLFRHGLVDHSGQLSPLGLSVREILITKEARRG